MLINQVSKKLTLTKKAIEYYIEHGLIRPVVLENGYRDFSQGDVERLEKISIYRRLGLSVFDIKAVLSDTTGDSLQRIAIQKELSAKRDKMKKAALDKLCRGQTASEINADLEAIDLSLTVTEKLLEAFPGYYGRFICLHFARFLNEPITTVEERLAYSEVLAFLDNTPQIAFPEDLQTLLDENTTEHSPEVISAMLDSTKQAIENPDKYISDNKEVMEQYLKFRQSEEYKESSLNRLQALLKEFCNTSGYYDVFIPAMKRLSKSYAEYSRKMELANETLLSQFPEIEQLLGGE